MFTDSGQGSVSLILDLLEFGSQTTSLELYLLDILGQASKKLSRATPERRGVLGYSVAWRSRDEKWTKGCPHTADGIPGGRQLDFLFLSIDIVLDLCDHRREGGLDSADPRRRDMGPRCSCKKLFQPLGDSPQGLNALPMVFVFRSPGIPI